jgi:lipopolysaccharide transport system ATP-binding protein
MGNTAIKVENLSKIYRLGEIGTGTISRDMERWFKTKVLKQEDPFLKIGETNDRANKGESDIVYSLRDINFEIEQGDAVGIIGRNGAGKSTLLKILSRVTTPTTGKINIKGRVASLLEVGTGFHPELTGRENIYLNGAILGMRKREIDRKLDEIIDFSGVERYIDTPVKRYSSGMYVRLAFAVAAHLESEILIVDEVLAVGDAEFQKKCLGKMGDVSKGEGRTVLFVSHNMAAVQKLCGKGILLEYGKVVINDSICNVTKMYSDYQNFGIYIYKSKTGFCRKIEVKQIEDGIIVDFSFYSEFPILDFVLGFMIKDINDYPLSVLNNKNFSDRMMILNKGFNNVSMEFLNVNLYDNLYKFDFYFGDGGVDFEIVEDQILFSFTKMKKDYFDKANSTLNKIRIDDFKISI